MATTLTHTRDVQVGQRVRIQVGFDACTVCEGVVTQKGVTFGDTYVPDAIVFTTDDGQTKYALGKVPIDVLSEER